MSVRQALPLIFFLGPVVEGLDGEADLEALPMKIEIGGQFSGLFEFVSEPLLKIRLHRRSRDTQHFLLRRVFHDAKLANEEKVVLWGTGTPLRELIFVDDLADAIVHLAEHYDEADIVNIGTGKELSIASLAELIRQVSGYQGEIEFDSTMPDGTPRKLLDVTRLNELGWQPKTSLQEAMTISYRWFVENQDGYRQ